MSDLIGLYDQSTGTFFLRNADASVDQIAFGGVRTPARTAITGDWDDDGETDIGLYDGSTGRFFLRDDDGTVTEISYGGVRGRSAITGDWDNDGDTDIGLYDAATGQFFLRDSDTGATTAFFFGGVRTPARTAITGDWDDDGDTDVGLYDASTGRFFLRDGDTAAVTEIAYGGIRTPARTAITGDWDDDGDTEIGLYDASTGRFFQRNDDGTTTETAFGGVRTPARTAITGDWDGDTPPPPTFTLDAAPTSVNEASTITFTVTLAAPATEATTVTFRLQPGDAIGINAGTTKTNLADFASGAANPVTVPIAAGETTATFTLSPIDDSLAEFAETFSVEATVNGVTASLGATVLDGTIGGGQIFNLTEPAENKTGTSGDDTFNGSNTTLVLDVLNGAGGTDTLNYSDASKTGANINALGLSLTSVEVVNVRSVASALANTSAFAGVTSLNILQGTDTTVAAAASTNIAVSGIAGAIGVDGGKDISVTDSTAGQDITIGATTVNAGTVTVTDTKVGAGTILVDGGTNVTINATGSTGGTDTIEVGTGGAATDLPSGLVSVTSAHTGVAATDVILNAIEVSGGSSVTVTQTADTSKAAADTTGATLAQGAVTVVGGDTTTTVTVNQAKSTAEVLAVAAVAGKTETASVKFDVLKSGDTLTLDTNANNTVDAGELTFTASTDMTAAEVAAAFANLINGTLPVTGDTQGSGLASKGTYTGIDNTWTSAAASGDTVVFTSTTINTDVTDLAFKLTNTSGSSKAPVVTTTGGSGETLGVTGVLGVANGAVLIDDNATASITSVTIDGYADASKIGNTATLSKLANLTLANSGSSGIAGETDGSMTVDAQGVSSLNLTVNNILGAVSLDGAGDNALKTLNLTASGADSAFALTAAAVKTLAVSGDKTVDLSTATLTALETVTVSGSASLTLDGDEADTLTSVTTSATTGAVAATINGTLATYTGGAGADTVTLATGTALTKAIDLGAGDDTLSFAALNVTGSTATLSGGDGVDTLSMATVTAAALDGSKQTFYTGFERLTINDAAGNNTIDLANLGFTNYVSTNGSTGTLTLDKLANNGTVVLNAAPTTGVTVQIADAATGKADVLNLETNVTTADINFKALTAANVETVNIKTNDTDTLLGIETATLDLNATSATKIAITGNGDLALDNAGNTKVTEIDGSTMSGVLTVTAAGTTAATIKGGLANDILTASTAAIGTINAAGTGAVIKADGTAGSADGKDATKEAQTLTVTADGVDDDNEVITVTYGTNASGGTGALDIDLSGVTVTNKVAVAAAVKNALNVNGAFSGVASASVGTTVGVNDHIVTITYNTAAVDINTVVSVAVKSGNTNTLAFAPATTATGAAAVAEVTTVVLTDGTTNTGLSAGDTMSLLVGGTTFTYTAPGTVDMDTAAAGLAALIDADSKAGATYTAGSNTLTITAATAGATGLSVGSYAVADVSDVAATADTLIGNAGDDTLIANSAMSILTGGQGHDLFVIGTASLNVNSYSTLTDFSAGDLIQFTGADSFAAAKVTLGDTAVFQDYANAAMNSIGINDVAWFQHAGNTYIVMDAGSNSTTFVNGEDYIVKLSGLVDLSTATFNSEYHTIGLA